MNDGPAFLSDGQSMADAEARMGLQPIHELNAERQKLVGQVADYRAKYGSFGTWDAIRKSTLSQIRMSLRAHVVQRSGAKVTESQLDEEAHADARYVDLITQATRERAQMAVLEARIESIDATINRGQAVARYLAAERTL